jgi:hypothetical protein
VKKFPVGSKVIVLAEPGSVAQDAPATVVKHGRDSCGIYTEVEFSDGRREQCHRDYLRAVPGLRSAE